MKKIIELALLVSLLISTQQAKELNFDNEPRHKNSKNTDLSISNEDKTESTITRVSPQSKLLKIRNSIKSLDFQIEQFPKELEAFKAELSEYNSRNLEILDAINQHLLTERLGDSDNPVVRKAIQDHYIEYNFGDDLIRMRGEVEQMIAKVIVKIKDANIKVAAIPGLIKIRDGLKIQLRLLEGGL